MSIVNFYNVDCIQFMKDKPDGFWDLAICDPDFGLDDKISEGGTWAAKYKKGDGVLGGKPTKEYFDQLFRTSKNQIIWGGNYFIDFLYSSRCYIIWDKIAQMDTLADCEMAWTSFDKNAKIFRHARNTSEKRIHITQKPIDLYRWTLQKFATKGMKILDTHGGSMSSAIACDMEGYDLDICEIYKYYFDAGVSRFKEHRRHPVMFPVAATQIVEQGRMF